MEKARVIALSKAVALWLPSLLLGTLFVLQGVFKLQPGSPWPEMFARWGLPDGAHLAVGLVELLGGLALLVPRTAAYAAGSLAVVMLGACATHWVHAEYPSAGFTFVLASVFVALGWARRRSRARSA